jgi:hypothetical protein
MSDKAYGVCVSSHFAAACHPYFTSQQQQQTHSTALIFTLSQSTPFIIASCRHVRPVQSPGCTGCPTPAGAGRFVFSLFPVTVGIPCPETDCIQQVSSSPTSLTRLTDLSYIFPADPQVRTRLLSSRQRRRRTWTRRMSVT